MDSLDSTKARIVEAAGTVFARKGFEAATIREICEAAGVNLAAVNYHFGDKQRLQVEVIKQAHLSRTQDTPLPQWKPGTPPERKLRDFVRMMLNRMLHESSAGWHHEVLLRAVAQPSAACAELIEAFIRPQFEILKEILDELLPADTPERTRHLIVFSIVGQCMHYRVARGVIRMLVSETEYRTFTPDSLADHISGVVLAAVGHGPPVVSETENVA